MSFDPHSHTTTLPKPSDKQQNRNKTDRQPTRTLPATQFVILSSYVVHALACDRNSWWHSTRWSVNNIQRTLSCFLSWFWFDKVLRFIRDFAGRSGACGAVITKNKQRYCHSRENGNPAGVNRSLCIFWIPVFTGMTVVVIYRSNLQKIVSHATSSA